MDWNNWYIGFVKKTVFYNRFPRTIRHGSRTPFYLFTNLQNGLCRGLASAVRSSPAYAGYVHVAQPLDPALLVVRIKQAQCFA